MHTDHSDVIAVAKKAYPDYNGRKFRVEVCPEYEGKYTIDVRSSWEGGSRNYFTFLRLDTGNTMEVPAQSAFDAKIKGADSVALVPGLVCVEHSYFCGKDMGIRIHIHPANVPALLPPAEEVSRNEKIVLVFTRSFKPSYNGITNYRYHEAHRETGITEEEWNAAKADSISKGWMDKRGALTIEGKNIAGKTPRYSFKETIHAPTEPAVANG